MTGATGFVGSEFIREVLNGTIAINSEPTDEPIEILALVRSWGGKDPAARFAQVERYWNKFSLGLTTEQRQHLKIIPGDLEDNEALPGDLEPCDVVVHCAACTDLGVSLAEGRKSNVTTTAVALKIAKAIKAQCFIHLSTAFVAGVKRGNIKEADQPKQFVNHYEQTKWEAEELVRSSGLPHIILRPSIIVGRRDNGFVWRMKVLYSVWRVWMMQGLPRAPIAVSTRVDVIPIDYVTQAIGVALTDRAMIGETWHLCSGEASISPVELMKFAAQSFGVPTPKLSPAWLPRILLLPWVYRFLPSQMKGMLLTLRHHLPYLGTKGRIFNMDKTNGHLGSRLGPAPAFRDYGSKIFDFCKQTAWGKRGMALESTPMTSKAPTGSVAESSVDFSTSYSAKKSISS